MIYSRTLPVLVAVAFGTLVPGAHAATQPDIQGVWSFGGGKVDIEPTADGTLTGTVIADTKFGDCPHPAGEMMWTSMTALADGSYAGRHQWYRSEKTGCVRKKPLGKTAWRVLVGADGARRLRVCFSNPSETDPQPTIAANGSSTGATFGCVDSAFIANTPAEAGVSSPSGTSPSGTSTTGTPSTQAPAGSTGSKTGYDPAKKGSSPVVVVAGISASRSCVSRRNFRIRVRKLKTGHYVSVSVYVNGKRVRTLKGSRLTAVVNLRGLPKGTSVVKIRGTTSTHRTITATRKFHTCVLRSRKSS